jgi:SAM-dependent methyltransferase
VKLRLEPRLRLVLLSCLMLFVELALIRWTGSNVVYLSYFSNFVLLGSFLGIGIGFLRGKTKTNLFPYAPVALTFFVAFVLLFPVQIDRSGSDLIFFGDLKATGLPSWVTLPVVFLAAAGIMALIAEGVARQFNQFEALEAYRLDIGGSLLGIVAFSILSFLWAPPVVWGTIAAGLFAVLLAPPMRILQAVALVGLVFMLGRESIEPVWSWSPYYKVTVQTPVDAPDVTGIQVNGIPHQAMVTIEEQRARGAAYFLPYERIGDVPGEVLIVGAGSGTDVAIALEQGVMHVDAVEIDPRLQQIGAEGHPERPYDDPRVTVIIDDGRAFLERTQRTYDLIVFALPDSLTLVSGQSALRLESYLFTLQAMEEARSHLAPGGSFAMYNYYREAWLIDRLAGTLEAAYGHPPCVDSISGEGGLAVLTVGLARESIDCPGEFAPTDAAAARSPASDDYPFLYLRDRGIPFFYLGSLALVLAASLALTRWASGPLVHMRGYADLFFMGVAFLLLETKSVVQFALLFGTTWFVNALVFAGVLTSVLAAIEVARRVSLPHPAMLYAVLLATLLVAWLIPPDALLQLDLPLRFAAAVVIWFSPIFLANLVFAQRFRDVREPTVAFGANLLGAMVGGVLEYLALLTGYQTLLLVVAAVYALAFLAGRTHFALAPMRRAIPAGD